MTSLSDDQTAELKEHFEYFDIHSEGFVYSKDLGKIMRGWGINLTEASLTNMINEVQQDGKIMFPDYLTLMARRMSDPGLQEETIMESFAVFDKDRNGTVEAAELKHVLCKMGEFMDAKEVDKIIADFAEVDGEGKINYADFVKNMNDQCGIFL
mmetsp:Transcript_86946/g.130354  ORF Transcript_86946/g.130354 Transcript_86946/m.130354 type:complete len:154 (+) Transcript_86946:117-578(+)